MNTQMVLSIEDAKHIAEACRAKAREQGWNVVIAIVDEGAHLMYLERMDGTQKASSIVAVEKAKTALLFKRPTKALEATVLAGRSIMMMLPGATPIEGGLPLVRDDQFLGAVGISGVQSFEDGIVAEAGVSCLASLQ
jgi:glc operon protein GlcG